MKIQRFASVYLGLLKTQGRFYYASSKSREYVIEKLLKLAQK
jgi:hypothetical protein